jgi:nitroreductase
MNDPIGPVGILSTEQVRAALVAATAAPSLHNSQPWRFQCAANGIQLYADHTRAVPAADPDHRELTLACGAALLNLRIAIKAMGALPDVRILPDRLRPDLLATVRPAGRRTPTPLDQALARAIPRRRTNRRPFADGAVPPPIRHELRLAAEAERAWLAILEPAQLPLLRVLVRRAHATQLADPEFLAEWAHWTGRVEPTPDGVPARNSGPLPEPQDRWTVRDFSGGQARERLPGKDFESDPLIAVIGSFQDGPTAWLQAGQAMQRVLLTATAAGLAASFVSQVVEVPATRRDLRTLIGGAVWPQTVLRIGYGSPVPATPRRDIYDGIAGHR